MRILVVTYEFPPIGGGGGRAAQDICYKLVQLGHEVRVLTSHLKGLAYQETVHGLEVTRVRAARRLPYKASLLDMGGLLMDLQDLLNCKVDVVSVRGLKARIRDRVLKEAVRV